MIDLFDKKEHNKSNNEKIDKDIKKDAVVDSGRSGRLSLSDRCVISVREVDIEVGKLDLVEEESDRWHDDIAHERGDDLAKGGADNDTDRHIDHIAFDSKFFKFFEHSVVIKDWDKTYSYKYSV